MSRPGRVEGSLEGALITVNPIKLETGLRPNSAGIPYALLLRIEAMGFQLLGFYCKGFLKDFLKGFLKGFPKLQASMASPSTQGTPSRSA